MRPAVHRYLNHALEAARPRLAALSVVFPLLLERHAGLRHPDGRPGDCEEGDGPKNGTCFGDGQEGFEEDVSVQSHGLNLW